jgi:4-diphosphocytidyl-2-C-methyl-D-erythritol kinase
VGGSVTVRARAFAKINLSLRVLGTRADGYHDLRTIFQSIALHDTLTIRAQRGPFHLTCDDPRCPDDNANLIWRAAEGVWGAAGRRGAPRDVTVDLKKRIPMQAGLGGGSSDAAAALRAFARLWRVDEPRVREIGRELGADVPYFFEGGTVLGLERGDQLFPLLDRPTVWVVLVLPDFGVSTKDAFSWWGRSPERLALQQRARDAAPGAQAFRKTGARAFQVSGSEPVNDLEAPVAAHHPEIRRIVSALRRFGAGRAAMSGSGSTVFGLFRSERAAARAARAVETRAQKTLITTTIDRKRYGRASLPTSG